MLRVKLEHVKKVWKAKSIVKKTESKKRKAEKAAKQAGGFEVATSKPLARAYDEPVVNTPKPKAQEKNSVNKMIERAEERKRLRREKKAHLKAMIARADEL